jgi:hypothetical protein
MPTLLGKIKAGVNFARASEASLSRPLQKRAKGLLGNIGG